MIGPVTFTYDELLAHKAAGVPAAAIDKLRRDADGIIADAPWNVTMRTLRAPSGDPHDYMSMGPYWWPNPDTEDGLPYISRDGLINPETVQKVNIPALYGRMYTLALAAFYLGDKKYSEYAERQLYDWFINPETKMNPNARYAQAVPGRTDGDCYGLIDFATASSFFDALGILDAMSEVSQDIIDGTREWYKKFTDWMLTSDSGIAAGNCTSNHGTWYDAHIISAAVGTGRYELARRIFTTAYDNRVRRGIRADGGMPRELDRTAAMSYTFFNLDALLIIARIAEGYGIDEYWSVDKERGVCLIKHAVDFIYPYVKNPETFPYKELRPQNQWRRIKRALRSVDKRFSGEGYAERIMEFPNDDDDISRLVPVK